MSQWRHRRRGPPATPRMHPTSTANASELPGPIPKAGSSSPLPPLDGISAHPKSGKTQNELPPIRFQTPGSERLRKLPLKHPVILKRALWVAKMVLSLGSWARTISRESCSRKRSGSLVSAKRPLAHGRLTFHRLPYGYREEG